MKVLVINGCWSPNIGNAFVNIGTEQIVRQVFEGCDIAYSADVANKWFFGEVAGLNKYEENSFNISRYINVDLVVWGGMVLTKHNFQLAEKIFVEINKKGIPLLLLGAGADEYTKEEADYVADILYRLRNVGIITRDDKSYDMFNKYDHMKWRIVRGIDAAFFVSDYNVPVLDIENYDIECFDRIVTPYIEHEGKRVITTHHDCFGKLPTRYVCKEDTLISELPYDYLTLYKNVDTTYTERVHACIATLAYGNKARLYAKTPRASLFDRVIKDGEERIRKEVVSVDVERFYSEKENMKKNTWILYNALRG